MESIGIRELKQNASEVIARVARGEWLIVTDRGRPVAQISPIRTSALSQMLESGQIRPPSLDFDDLPPPRPATRGKTLSQEIIDERRED